MPYLGTMRPLFRLIYFRLMGWTIVDDRPPVLDRCIYVVAPHTSNWDFIIGVMVRSIVRLGDVRYLAKDSLFKPPFGWVFRALGGYPVDRSRKHNLVHQVADYFRTIPGFKIAITPEGTRKRVETWKTGFYHIAREAQVPLILTALDYGNKRVTFSAPFLITGDVERDIERMKDHFRPINGRNPELGVF